MTTALMQRLGSSLSYVGAVDGGEPWPEGEAPPAKTVLDRLEKIFFLVVILSRCYRFIRLETISAIHKKVDMYLYGFYGSLALL
ncbi:Os04g0223600, partial [Oryza sativa Japonica Group]